MTTKLDEYLYAVDRRKAVQQTMTNIINGAEQEIVDFYRFVQEENAKILAVGGILHVNRWEDLDSTKIPKVNWNLPKFLLFTSKSWNIDIQIPVTMVLNPESQERKDFMKDTENEIAHTLNYRADKISNILRLRYELESLESSLSDSEKAELMLAENNE